MLPRCAALCVMVSLSLICCAGEASQVAKRLFRSRDVPQVELLQDGSFENVQQEGSWAAYEDGFERDNHARTGKWAVRCEGDGHKKLGAHQHIEFTTPSNKPLLVGGWSRAEEAGIGSPSDYSIYVDIYYDDGTPLWGQIVPFDGGTHDWQYQEKLIWPQKPVRSVEVYALFRGRTGTVWFDDITVKLIDLPGTVINFDGASVSEDRPLRVGNSPVSLASGDALLLALDSRSGAVEVRRAGGKVNVSSASCGFLLRDVAAESDFFAPTWRIQSTNGQVHARGRVPELGLRLNADYIARDEHIEVTGTVYDITGKDRAISVYFALPIDALGWTWWDDTRTGRRIERDREYKHTVTENVGAIGQHSLYPFSCISSTESSVSLATPMDWPRISRTVYDARSRQLYIVFDLALTPATKRFPSRADFRFIIYTSDPRWGFRAAAQKYYDIYPQFFVNRTPKQGLWMPFTDISTVRKCEDFCFAFQEGAPNPKWDDEHGVLSFVYIEPMSFWQPLAKGIPRTYEACIAELERNKREGDSERKKMAWATELCGVKGRDGKFNLEIHDAPWCDGCVFALNCSPNVKTDGKHENKAEININSVLSAIANAEKNGANIDGTYLDSLEGWGWAQNFRRDHFAVTTIPLTYTLETREPVLLNIFSTYEFTRSLEREMRKRGKLMMANSVPSRWAFFAHLLDVMGTETNWGYEGKWTPMSHSSLAFRRTMCYQRPYCLLQNTVFKDFGPDFVKKYMERSLFYGVYPGFFSPDGATDPYFGNPEYYERDRAILKKYIPIIKEIGEAGWQPITYAVSSEPDVWIERFGPTADGRVYFTVMNTAETARRADIQIDVVSLRLPDIISVEELISRRPLRTRNGQFRLRLEPEQVMALRCSVPAK